MTRIGGAKPVLRPFGDGDTGLEELDPRAAAELITALGDVALVVDPQGIIRNVALSTTDPDLARAEAWVGRKWVDTVTTETRPKVEQMLRDVATTGTSARRQVNHLATDGGDFPVTYSAVRLGTSGMVMAVGRELRALSSLQKRLVETQQAMERDYWRLRHTETRYRLLFQLSNEAVLVVDAATRRVVEANAAAARFFDIPAERLIGRLFPLGVDVPSHARVEDLLATTRASGHGEEADVRLADGRTAHVTASCFRQESATLFLVRFAATGEALARLGPHDAAVLELLGGAPDGFVLTSNSGEILWANQGFLDLAQLPSLEQAQGRNIAEWVGRPGADLQVMLSMLGKHDVVRLLSTSARGELGLATEVEVSAVWHKAGDLPAIGFFLRDVGRRVAAGATGARDLTTAVQQLTELVGRTSLPELLRDTTSLVERHFIEAALNLANDNRTAAAEILGLSRQSLYVKMRRYGLAGGEPQDQEDPG